MKVWQGWVLLGVSLRVATACAPSPGLCDDFAGDTDDDGICDAFDNCIAAENADQDDADDDGVGDACDNIDGTAPTAVCVGQGGDVDNDNVCAVIDNCPDDANTDQADIDRDDIGDACDDETCDGIDNDKDGAIDEGFADEDADGVANCVDGCRGQPDIDTDSDGLLDCADACPRDDRNDVDQDGACADVDLCPEVPSFFADDADIDGDGIGDVCDIEDCDGRDNNGNGVSDEGFPDADGDAVCDGADRCPGDLVNDDDDDGLCGAVDNCPVASNVDQADADDDGVGDACDLDAEALCGEAAPLVDLAVPGDIAIRGMTADPGSNAIYLAIDSSAGSFANRVVAIDGATGRVAWSVVVGSEPAQLALSDDGGSLYVALRGSTSVRLIDTRRRRACGSFQVHAEQTFFGPAVVGDMDVMPGRPQTLVVSAAYTGVSPDYGGTFVYDGGTRRPVGTGGHTGARLVEVVSETEAYGFNCQTTEFGFRRLAISARGIEEVQVVEGLIEGFNCGGLEHAGDRVYGGSTSVDFGRMTRAGSFQAQGPMAVDDAAGEAFFVEDGAIRVFDADLFLPLRSVTLPASISTPDFFGGQLAIARYGDRGIVVADDDSVALLPDAVTRP